MQREEMAAGKEATRVRRQQLKEEAAAQREKVRVNREEERQQRKAQIRHRSKRRR